MKTIIYSITLFASALFVSSQANAQAELQVIHNAADPAAATVDIYVNGTNAIDDFEFRTATPFISLPSGVPLNIGVAPGNSISVDDTLKNFTITLMAGEKYIAIARGVLTPASFAVNPDGLSTAFDLTLIANAQTAATLPGNVDLAVHHGAADAPAVDVIARNVATLVENAAFSDATPYFAVPPGNYLLDITPATNNSVIVATYAADLTGLAGGAAVVFASGFLDPAFNQNGPAFGLFAALPTGTVVALPQTSAARLQVIHNAADPAAASVDVYLNGTLALPAFAFRTATPFIDVPGDVIVNIGVAPSGSSSVNDTIANFQVQFVNGQTYAAIANGVLNPANFAANPDGISTAFNIWLQQDIRENSLVAGDVDFIAVHGASDAPTVDIQLNGAGAILVNNAAYGDITSYLSVSPAAYTLDVTPGNDNSVILATYVADLSGLADGTAIVFASGFLDPSANQNGAGFGLWATLADGTTFPLPVVTGVSENNEQSGMGIYPNPVASNSALTIINAALRSAHVEILNANGKTVKSVHIPAGVSGYEISTEGLPGGVYAVKSVSEGKTAVTKLIIQ